MYASCTDVGGRLYNEDCVAYKQLGDDCLCVVLADGLGGHGGGEIASKTAVDTILTGWNRPATPASLCDLIQEAHRRILLMQTAVCRMKTTAVILSVDGDRALWAHVGDSRLYHFI